MPAILRNRLPNYDPSQSNIGSYAFNDRVGVGTTRSPPRPPCRISWAEPESANIIGCRTVWVAHRPSGPPDCVSIIPTVMSRILSRIFDCFGLIRAAGKGW